LSNWGVHITINDIITLQSPNSWFKISFRIQKHFDLKKKKSKWLVIRDVYTRVQKNKQRRIQYRNWLQNFCQNLWEHVGFRKKLNIYRTWWWRTRQKEWRKQLVREKYMKMWKQRDWKDKLRSDSSNLWCFSKARVVF